MYELWINGRQLVERWKIHSSKLYDRIMNGLPAYPFINGELSKLAVDPFSWQSDFDLIDLHFLMSDVEIYEARFFRIKPIFQFRIKPTFQNSHNIKKEVKDIDQTSTSIPERNCNTFQQHRTKPEIVFYEDGEFFLIGKNGEEKPFKIIKGLQIIHYLLQKPQQNFPSVEVFHYGIKQVTNKGAMAYDEMAIKRAPYINSDKKARKAYKGRIEELKMFLHSQSADPHELLEAKEEIEKLKAALNHNTGSNEENARTNVRKAIKLALDKIHEMCPALESYLNISTIKTGYSCSYQPVPSDPVEWILFRE